MLNAKTFKYSKGLLDGANIRTEGSGDYIQL